MQDGRITVLLSTRLYCQAWGSVAAWFIDGLEGVKPDPVESIRDCRQRYESEQRCVGKLNISQ